jgi:hypothetical protein
MTHPTEEQLIAYRDGETARRDEIASHLKECGGCRNELDRTEAVLQALSNFPVPDPGEDYERRVWQHLAPKLPEKRARWWQVWFEPRRLATAGAVLVLVVAAFVAGRITRRARPDTTAAATQEQVRERVLVVAVGEHLGKSEMVLVELANAEPQDAKQKHVNISAEQRRAGDLLEENRLYRQTALQQGDTGLASVLDELERVLVDMAHSPDQVTPAQLESIQKRIEAHGLLFKVRVVGKELQQRQDDLKTAPAQGGQPPRERNKT